MHEEGSPPPNQALKDIPFRKNVTFSRVFLFILKHASMLPIVHFIKESSMLSIFGIWFIDEDSFSYSGAKQGERDLHEIGPIKVRDMFIGILENSFHGLCDGYTHDRIGVATILNLSMTEDKISFIKQYINPISWQAEHEPIKYTLYKEQGNTWIGEWSYPARGTTGVVRCTLSELPTTYFDEKSLRLALPKM